MSSCDASGNAAGSTTPLTAEQAAAPPQRAHKPHLLILVGVPGSGKSTVAERLRKEAGWAVVSQDALGDRRACVSATTQHMREGRNVVIDRCNFDVRQRATWLQVGCSVCGGPGGFVSMTLRLSTDMEECRRRIVSRTDHPTLNGPESAAVLSRFLDNFVGPKAAEGFTARYEARSPADVELLLPLLVAAGADSTAPAPAPSHLLDSGADPCYGRSARPAYQQPAWQQCSQPPTAQQRPSVGNHAQPPGARGRSWQPVRPRPQGGQLWGPPGAPRAAPFAHPRQPPAAPSRDVAGDNAAGGCATAGVAAHWAADASSSGSAPHWRPDAQAAPHNCARQHTADGGNAAADGLHSSISGRTARGASVQPHTMAVQQVPSVPVAGRQRPAPYRPPGW